MLRKSISVIMALTFIVAMFGSYGFASELKKSVTALSVGVVEKDLETNIVTKYVYSQNEDNSCTKTEIAQWLDKSQNSSESLGLSSPLLNTRSVIGNDGRTVVENTRQFPYSAIVHLEIYFGTAMSRGTGFFIADNVIATAGHCIYDEELGWATHITVRPARDGLLSIPYGLATVKTFGVSTQWFDSCDKNYDWGAVAINSGIVGNPGIFSISTIDEGVTSDVAKISGYPAYVGSSTVQTYKQYEMSGTVNVLGDYKFSYTIDSSEGQSGAPIINSRNEVIGIHTSSGGNINYGVQITPSVIYYMNEFISNYG